MKNQEDKYAEVYGGFLGKMCPLIVMIGILLVLSIAGLRSTQNYWCAGFFAMLVSFFLYKDKVRFRQAVINGVGNPTLAMMITILMIAGIMTSILSSSHLVDSLIWGLSKLHVSGSVIPLFCFLVGCLISTASGSSGTAIYTITPILFPVGVQMGCSAGLVLGAIASGAVFGDNLAPISDTTIASTLTQGVNIQYAVRTRAKYSIAAGIPSAILFLIFGLITVDANAVGSLEVDATYAPNLVFLILPIIMITMILMGVDFLAAMLVTEIIGVIMLFIFGYGSFDLLFATGGLIISGISSPLNAIVFMILIFIMLSLLTDTGALDELQEKMMRFVKSERSAEIVSGAFICLCVIMTTSGLSTISFSGPIVRRIVEPYKISRARTSNYLDGMCCAITWLLPYAASAVVSVGLAVATGVVDETFSAMDYLPYNFFCYALLIIYWGAILTGWGRTKETPEETEGVMNI